MCTPNVIVPVITSAASIAGKIEETNRERKNAKYQAQIALENAKNAKLQGLKEQQEGLEAARQANISALKELNEKKAKIAASGFDLNSQTNLMQLEDIYEYGESSADAIKKKYDNRARSYFDKANGYIGSANFSIESYNKSLLKKGIAGLGTLSSVNTDWYNKEREMNEYFKSPNF